MRSPRSFSSSPPIFFAALPDFFQCFNKDSHLKRTIPEFGGKGSFLLSQSPHCGEESFWLVSFSFSEDPDWGRLLSSSL